jgi:cyclohexanone monooxygenase
VLRVPGRPSLADFDLLGQKLQEDADPDRQEPTLPKIDSMQFVDVARVELLKNRDKPIGGDIIPDYERGQSNKSDTADGKRPQRVAIADLNIARGRYPLAYQKRRTSFGGFDYQFLEKAASEVSDEERQATFERIWEIGGLAPWVGSFNDLFANEQSNRAAYDFWRDKTRARIKDPALAEVLAPTEPIHPYGTKRPSLEQNFFDIFNQSNVSLVDLRKTPIERVTRSGIKTAAGEHDLDVLVLATGFDAVTGGLTSIDIRGTGGQTLKEKWAKGVQAHLGMAAAGFPNLLFVYGPQSPNAFANGPTCAELQGDWIVQLLDHVRQRNFTRVEATVAAEEAWRAQVLEIASGTLFPRADSWYVGANIPGKPREMLSFAGGLSTYMAKCNESAERGYEGFKIG